MKGDLRGEGGGLAKWEDRSPFSSATSCLTRFIFTDESEIQWTLVGVEDTNPIRDPTRKIVE